MTLLWQPMNSRLWAVSIAIPVGSSQFGRGEVLRTLYSLESNSTSCALSSMLTHAWAAPSAAAASGLSPSGAAGVENENAVRCRVVHETIRAVRGRQFDFADGRERFQIEDGYRIRTSIAGKSSAELRHQLRAVGSLQVGDIADDGAVGIHNHDVRAPRDEQA